MPPPPDLASASPGYRGDLAYAHQTGHSDFVRLAAVTVLEQLRAHGIPDGLVVDLGCGTGILARQLTDAGYRVLGVDLSADMVALARDTAPDADFAQGSFLDVELPPCVAVTSIGQSLGYAFDPRVDASALDEVFGRAGRALRPGGLLLFDLNAPVPTSSRDHRPQQHFRHTDEWSLCVETVIGDHVLTRDITVFRRHGAAYRRSDEHHEVLLVEPVLVLEMLARNGFDAELFHDYDGADFPPLLVGYRAVKRR